jgi:hypothetical protein
MTGLRIGDFGVRADFRVRLDEGIAHGTPPTVASAGSCV